MATEFESLRTAELELAVLDRSIDNSNTLRKRKIGRDREGKKGKERERVKKKYIYGE